MIELYHFWSSVCSVKVRMCLEEKNCTWQSRYVDLFSFQQMEPDYLALNPDGVVPTLVHNGVPVRESSVINEYIDEAFDGPALQPATPLDRARMREFIRRCDDGLPAVALPTLVKYILPKLRNRWDENILQGQAKLRPAKFLRSLHERGLKGAVEPEELEAAYVQLEHLLDAMESMLAQNGPWLIGEFSLADIAVAPYLFRLSALDSTRFLSSGRRPHVDDWYDRISKRPAFIKAVSWPDEAGGGYEEVGLHASHA